MNKIIGKIKKYPLLEIFFLIIISIGILVSIIQLKTTCAVFEWCGMDIDQYYAISTSILNNFRPDINLGSVYNLSNSKEYYPEVRVSLGFPYLIAFLRLIYDSPKVLIIFNYFLYITAAIFLFKIIILTNINKFVAAIIALFVLLNPNIIASIALPGVDLPTITVLLFIFLQLVNGEYNNKLFFTCIAALFSLTLRSNLFLFILPLFIFNMLRKRKYIIILLALFLLYLILCIRTYYYTGIFSVTGHFGHYFSAEYIALACRELKFEPSCSSELMNYFNDKSLRVVYTENCIENGGQVLRCYGDLNKYLTNATLDFLRGRYSFLINHFLIATGYSTNYSYSSFYLNFIYANFDHLRQISNSLMGNTNLTSFLKWTEYLQWISLFPLPLTLIWGKFDRDHKFLFLYISLLMASIISIFVHGLSAGARTILIFYPLLLIVVAATYTNIIISLNKIKA
ncbi:hypothetical protein [Polynucleobacter sp. MWH-UH35A]|uniref:hypothetical protein n=1 Tax=Polynucleobacter sp. MWH-UH35A TaxID=1855619 RepID=UPI001BFDAD91|nr:hypothetical protein [Polynucleobacter sp. MWH-UH35A]QWD60447.1 hypothetical protein ICV36_01775 [Polynucleobacter sp. MWH-UH35A]